MTATADDVISIGKELFLPDGKCCYGNEVDMSFGIANYQHEDLSEINNKGITQAFTLEKYLESSKLTRIRLYLTSKINTYYDSDDEQELNNSVFLPKNESSATLESIEERRRIVEEQDIAYESSLKIDQEKEAQKKQEITEKRDHLLKELKDAERKEKLRESRQARVPLEPAADSENCILVHVRHSSMGVIQRRFKHSDKVAAIYDWVGSLSDIPEHFELTDHALVLIAPSQPITVITSMLYMNESDSTPHIEEDVNFRGFGPIARNSEDDTIILDNVDLLCSSLLPHIDLPRNLLQDDDEER